MKGFNDLRHRGLDWFVKRLRSRLEHLDEHSPSERQRGYWNTIAQFPESTDFGRYARLVNPGPKSNIELGNHCSIQGELMCTTPQATIRFGDFCTFGEGSRIWSQISIAMGNYVLIAHQVDIHDSNSHSLDWRARRDDPVKVLKEKLPLDFVGVAAAPVVIEDDVWIGFKSTILKGVRIGRGAVIAACSVVTKDVLPFTLVAGNPARVIKTLNRDAAE